MKGLKNYTNLSHFVWLAFPRKSLIKGRVISSSYVKRLPVRVVAGPFSQAEDLFFILKILNLIDYSKLSTID